MILEITESAAMTDVAHCLENLARLRMKGFGLSIDDYGTGYSSMQQLSRIPFSELKIDRSFVTDVALHPQRRVILASSIDMARKLGLKVVAEGVESPADWDRLKELGCTIAQGYFIAKPMPASEFINWAASFSSPH
jgi:EAL domain-containing protein (putative c-di-GMP-specific phosphodiesterase class I)